MRSMQRGWFGEERDLLMVPVDEYLARRGEDIGSTAFEEASLQESPQRRRLGHGHLLV